MQYAKCLPYDMSLAFNYQETWSFLVLQSLLFTIQPWMKTLVLLLVIVQQLC